MEFTLELAALCGFALLAGFVDAVVGGGGLIQIPALFVLMPEAAPAVLLGTNKFASVWGTTSAAIQYLRRVPVEWRATLPAAIGALIFGFLGARVAAHFPPDAFRPLILILLVTVLAYTLAKKDIGALHAPRWAGHRQTALGLLVGTAIGFYDGFFGPGTGSFLIIAFVGLFGFSFLAASASAKVVNVVTNVAALSYFVATDHIRYDIAVPMALFNVGGSLLGTHMAIRKGNAFVRRLFIGVVSLLMLRFAWDLLAGR
ncbi:MAG TPA: TSUP family transporter [Fontimonas sp.]